MPVALENKLKQEAATKGLGQKRAAAYVYGTLRKTGWVPSTQKTMRHEFDQPKKLGEYF